MSNQNEVARIVRDIFNAMLIDGKIYPEIAGDAISVVMASLVSLIVQEEDISVMLDGIEGLANDAKLIILADEIADEGETIQ